MGVIIVAVIIAGAIIVGVIHEMGVIMFFFGQ